MKIIGGYPIYARKTLKLNKKLWDDFTAVILHKFEIFQTYSSLFNQPPNSRNFSSYSINQVPHGFTDQTVCLFTPTLSDIRVQASTTTNIVNVTLCARFADKNLLQP